MKGLRGGGGGGEGGGVACDANFFVCVFVNYYSKTLLQLCQLYSTGHFIAELTLYQMLLHRADDRGNVS